jgi:hypothetical protein
MPFAHGFDDSFTPDDYRAHDAREAAMLAMIPGLRLALFLGLDPAEFATRVYTQLPLSCQSLSAQLTELSAIADFQFGSRAIE